MTRFELRTNSRDDVYFYIIHEYVEGEVRVVRRSFKELMELYCEKFKSRTSQSTGHNTKKEEKI